MFHYKGSFMHLEMTSSLSAHRQFQIPLRIVNTEQNTTGDYIGKLRNFLDFAQSILQTYYNAKISQESLKNRKATFSNQYLINNGEVFLKPLNKPLESHRAQIIKAIDSIFRHCFYQAVEARSKEPIHDVGSEQNIENTQEEVSPHSLLILPNELLTSILNWSISNHWKSMESFALACKRFYQIAKDPQNLKILFNSNVQLFTSISASHIKSRLLSHTDFYPIQLDKPQVNLSDEDLKVLADHGTHLKTLSLQGGSFTPEGLAYLLQKCPQLRSLEFHQCQMSHFDDCMAVVSLYAPTLEHLKVVDCSMSDQALLALSMRPHQLRSFEYENSLSQGALTDYGFIAFFSSAHHLESIKLVGCPQMTQEPVMHYINGKDPSNHPHGNKLKKLNFSYCGAANQELFEEIATKCPHLEALELGFAASQCSTDKTAKQVGLIHIAQGCPLLQTLKIAHCSYLESSVIEQMLTHCPNLKHLELYQSNPLTPNFFKNLACCPHLRSFKFKPRIPAILTQQHLAALKSGCPELEQLALTNCQMLEGDLVNYLKNLHLTALQLRTCGMFGRPLLTALSQSCPQLEVLEIDTAQATRHPQPFDDQSIEQLAQKCPSLTTFSLNSSLSGHISPWQLSARTLHHLALHCSQLTDLSISHLNLLPNKEMTRDSIKEILASFTKRCLHIAHLGLPQSQATEEQIASLVFPYQHQLLSLNLEHSSKFKADFYQKLIACTQLHSLSLGHTLLDLACFKRLVKALPFLRYLDIRGCKTLINQVNEEQFSPTSFLLNKK
jgi:hypothetical protein